MKKLMVVLVVMAMVFASCERKSGHRSRSVQAEQMKPEIGIVVEIIGDGSPSYLNGPGTKLTYKHKAMVISDSTVCFVVLNNRFEIGDKIEIKSTQRITN